MFKQYRRRWQLAKAETGGGSPLPAHRFWQLLSRSLYLIELTDATDRALRLKCTLGGGG